MPAQAHPCTRLLHLELAHPRSRDLAARVSDHVSSRFVVARNVAGVIREVAETMCGGHDRLQSAIARGAARVDEGDHGEELIFFTTVSFGQKDCLRSSQSTTRQKATKESAWHEINEMLKSLGWGFKVDQRVLEAQLNVEVSTLS